jgi:hypothetical protein
MSSATRDMSKEVTRFQGNMDTNISKELNKKNMGVLSTNPRKSRKRGDYQVQRLYCYNWSFRKGGGGIVGSYKVVFPNGISSGKMVFF